MSEIMRRQLYVLCVNQIYKCQETEGLWWLLLLHFQDTLKDLVFLNELRTLSTLLRVKDFGLSYKIHCHIAENRAH